MALANTGTLSTNFNTDPYYDDYDERKNYSRVLFKPGLAVQARELTQLQTMLQGQIDRFGQHVFKEGSVVGGNALTVERINYVKIRDNDKDGLPVTTSAFIGTSLTGNSSGMTAIVLDYEDGDEATIPTNTTGPKTLYIKYTNSGANNSTGNFLGGETLTANSGITANSFSNDTGTGTGLYTTLTDGVIYAKDHFIRVDTQSKVIGRYNTNTNVILGYDIEENIINFTNDNTLLDPALGAYNYAAPGADRLQLIPTLTFKDPNATDLDTFVQRATIRNGRLAERLDKPQYNIIKDYIAQRTYDESGNYLVRGYNVSTENANTTHLRIGTSPGKAYVQGYDNELLVTYRQNSEKATSTTAVTGGIISTNYGNYITVNEMVGSWDLLNGSQIAIFDTITEAANTDLSVSTPNGSQIGTARLRAIEWISGNKGDRDTTYRFYLYDVVMTTAAFSTARAFFFDNGTDDAHADIILSGGIAVLSDTSQNDLLFHVPANNIASYDNTSYLYWTNLSGSITGTTGLAVISAPPLSTFNVSAMNETKISIDENFHIVVTGVTRYIDTGHTVGDVGTGDSFSFGLDAAKYNIGERIRIGGPGIVYLITNIVVNVITVHKAFSNESGDVEKVYAAGQYIPMHGYNGGNGGVGVRTAEVSGSNITFDIKETGISGDIAIEIIALINTPANQLQSDKTLISNTCIQINTSTHSASTAGPWNLGHYDGYKLKEVRQSSSTFTALTQGEDVTQYFELDSGMRDNFYTHAALKIKASSSYTPSDYLFVKFDRFTHGSTGHYFNVESYPAYATAPENIPIYNSPTTGIDFDLRNYIDARPHYNDTATQIIDSTTSVSENPTNGTVMSTISSQGIIAPNESLTTDYTYYLPRKDRVVVTSTGDINIVKGIPSLNPQTPTAPPDALTISIISIAAFPSLTYKDALVIDRTDLANRIEPVRQIRYTMKDIGVLNNRIDNLEYYTSLSLLEMATKQLTVSDVNGLDRFKNGILVDQFTGHNVGAPRLSDYKIAVDPKQKEIRPTFKIDDIHLKYDPGSGSVFEYMLVTKGQYIMFPYTHFPLISQPNAADIRSTTSSFYNYSGSLTLVPDTDHWVDTTNSPDINVNFDLNSDAWEKMSNSWGTEWNDWETVWTGVDVNTTRAGRTSTTTTTTTTNQERTGLTNVLVPETQTESTGDIVRNVNIIPHMRSRLIRFHASGMKPSTIVYPFFDDINVLSCCRTNNSDYTSPGVIADGTPLITDSNGDIYGEFLIPNSPAFKFAAGRTEFKLSDSIIAGPGGTTFASADYNASGLTQEVSETVISTRGVSIATQSAINTRTTTNSTITNIVDPVPRIPTGESTVCRLIWIDTGDDADFGSGYWAQDCDNDGEEDVDEAALQFASDVSADPIAQTFLVRTDSSQDTLIGSGAFLTKIDVYFQSKDASLPIFIEIREMDPSTSMITNRIVPFGKCTVYPADVNVSSAAPGAATSFEFDTPVFLLNNTEYAFIVKPAANSPNYSIWISRIGEDDITTGNRITQQPYSGVVMVSANDKTWTPIQEEDIKFDIYFADFSGGADTRDALFTNRDIDYTTIGDISGTTLQGAGERVHGETTLTLNAVLVSAANGDFLVGQNGANGEIVDTSAAPIYKVKDVLPLNVAGSDVFVDNENISLYKSGILTGSPTPLVSQSTPSGITVFYDDANFDSTILHMEDITGAFEADMWLNGQFFGGSAKIANTETTLGWLNIDHLHTKVGMINPLGTSVSGSAVLSDSTSTVSLGARTTINLNADTDLNARRYSRSFSDESGTKSNQLSLSMTRSPTNKFHAPVIDKERVAFYAIENFINTLTTGETSTSGGDALARYITKTVTLADQQDAEDLKAFITAYKPSSANIYLYYKILHAEDGDTIDERSWVQMTQVTNSEIVSDTENKNDYKEYEFSIPTANLTGGTPDIPIVQYNNSQSVTYTGFKRFAIKIVLAGSTIKVPRVTDLRVIALQA